MEDNTKKRMSEDDDISDSPPKKTTGQSSPMTDLKSYKTDPIINDPRQYQLEILEFAKHMNVIAYLGTGTGKTLIAVLLLKHMHEKETELQITANNKGINRDKKVSFFLVTTVPLVFQQAGVIQSNLSAKVGKYCGEMGVDYWDASKWASEIRNHDIIVCTAKIMDNLLHLGYILMEKINLIIFDECHNAVGKSPYRMIMQNFYFITPQDKRPKIFGLTASPINSGLEYNPEKIHKLLLNLETALNCRVITAKNTDELLRYLTN